MWRGAMFLLLIVSRSNTKVHLSADACSLDWPGVLLVIIDGDVPPCSPNPHPILDRKMSFFPSSPGPLYQNEVKCSAFDMKMILHSHANKTHFH